MQTYVDTWDRESLFGVNASDMIIEDGKVELKISALESDEEFHGSDTFMISFDKLRDFMCGFTINCEGTGNMSDSYFDILIKTKDGYVNFHPQTDDPDSDRLEDYIYWTEDGFYPDPELEKIQSKFPINPTRIDKDMSEFDPTKHIIAMSIDGYDSLFKRELPSAFFKGMKTFHKFCSWRDFYYFDPDN